MAGRGWRYSAREGKGRGPGGPQAHPRAARGVDVAGGWPAVAESMTAMRRSSEGIGDGGGFSGGSGSILRAWRQRTSRGIFSATQWSRGARDDGPRWRPWWVELLYWERA
jgi:hypothetical protein